MPAVLAAAAPAGGVAEAVAAEVVVAVAVEDVAAAAALSGCFRIINDARGDDSPFVGKIYIDHIARLRYYLQVHSGRE
jgi:hypothetical protein